MRTVSNRTVSMLKFYNICDNRYPKSEIRILLLLQREGVVGCMSIAIKDGGPLQSSMEI